MPICTIRKMDVPTAPRAMKFVTETAEIVRRVNAGLGMQEALEVELPVHLVKTSTYATFASRLREKLRGRPVEIMLRHTEDGQRIYVVGA